MRVPSGEIFGSDPTATFFGSVPSSLDTQTLFSRSKAILRCEAIATVARITQEKIEPATVFTQERFQVQLWCTYGGETRILDEAFQILAVNRHSVNRVLLFARLATEEEDVVIVDPNAIPA